MATIKPPRQAIEDAFWLKNWADILPAQARIDIREAANAFTKYEKLPLATKESLQAIADLFNVNFEFAEKGSKLMLCGISNSVLATYLTPVSRTSTWEEHIESVRKSQRFIKNSVPLYLHPGGNSKLFGGK